MKKEEKSAVLGFSFGYRKDAPGKSNDALISALYWKNHWLWRADMILQSELADSARIFSSVYFIGLSPYCL